MNTLSLILKYIINKIGDITMGTSAATLTGAIAETRLRTRNTLGKGTHTSMLLYGVHGFMGASGYAYLFIPVNLAADVTSVSSVTSIVCSIRTVSGTYLGGSGGVELISYYDTALVITSQPLLYVRLQNSSFGVTANTPLTGQVTMTFTLE